MKSQQTSERTMRSTKFNSIDCFDTQKFSKMNLSTPKTDAMRSIPTFNNLSVLDPPVSFKQRSPSLENINEATRRLNIELNTTAEALQEAIKKLETFSVSHHCQVEWKPCKDIEIVFDPNMALTQVERDRQKVRSVFHHGKVISHIYKKSQHYTNTIPDKMYRTRMSGGGLKIVPPKVNIIPQGDGVKHASIKYTCEDIHPAIQNNVDVYAHWLLAKSHLTLDDWATTEGYWFKNAKEKRAYTAKYGPYDRVKLLIFRGTESADKYDLKQQFDEECESFWADNANPITPEPYELSEAIALTNAPKPKIDIDPAILRCKLPSQYVVKDHIIESPITPPPEDTWFDPADPQTIVEPFEKMKFVTQGDKTPLVHEPVTELYVTMFRARMFAMTQIELPAYLTPTCMCDRCAWYTTTTFSKYCLSIALGPEYEQSMDNSAPLPFHNSMYNTIQERVLERFDFVAQGFGLSEGKAAMAALTAAMPNVEETMKSVTAACDKITEIIGKFDEKVDNMSDTADQFVGWFIKGFDHLNLFHTVTRVCSSLKKDTWKEIIINLLFEIVGSITVAVKQAKMSSAHNKLQKENESLKLRLETIKGLTSNPNNEKEILSVIRQTAQYATQGIGSLFSMPLFNMVGNVLPNLHLLRNFNTIVTALRNGCNIFEKLGDLLPACITELFGLVTDVGILSSKDFDSFAKKVHPVIVTYLTTPEQICSIPREQLVTYLEQALLFQRQSNLAINRGKFTQSLNILVRHLSDMISMHGSKSQLEFKRLNPFAILLSGPPRTGKSEVARKIANNIHDWVNDQRLASVDKLQVMGANRSTYAIQSQLDYMDGYAKEGVVIIDELGARNDGEDLDMLFSMVSSNTYVCPMASLQDPIIGKKGTTFTSHTVIACSNKDDFAHLNATYHTPLAITQRFIFRIEVNTNPNVPRRADFGHLLFTLKNFDGTPTFTLPELLYVLKEHKEGFINFFSARNNIDYGITQLKPVDLSFGTSDSVDVNAGKSFISTISTSHRAQGLVEDTCAFGISSFFLMNSCLATGRYFKQYNLLNFERWHLLNRKEMAWVAFQIITGIASVSGFAFLFYYTNKMMAVKDAQAEVIDDLTTQLQEMEKKLQSTPTGKQIHEHLLQIQSRSDKTVNAPKPRRAFVTQSLDCEATRTHALDFITQLLLDPKYEKVNAELKLFHDYIRDLPISNTVQVPFNVKKIPLTENTSRQFYAEAATDVAAKQLEEKLLHYMLQLKLTVDNCNYWICAIPLNHTHCLVPKHFFSSATGDHTLTLYWHGGDKIQEFKSTNYTMVGIANDAVIVTFPTLTWRFPNLMRHFVKSSELPVLKDDMATVVSINNIKNGYAMLYSTEITTLVEKEFYTDMNNNYQEIELVHGFKYTINSSVGDCGAPLVVHNRNLQGKIVGMHVAGSVSDPIGLGTLITFEMLEKHVPSSISYKLSECIAMGRMVSVGRLIKPIHVNRKTTFFRTDFNKAPVIKQPANLSFIDGHDQILTAMLKNAVHRSENRIAPSTLDIATNHIISKFPSDRDTTILTWQQAIGGYRELDGLNLKTSPGYPYILDSRKTDYIIKHDSGEYEVVDNQILLDCENLEKQATSYPPEIMWISSGKDELKKPGKICRVFEIAPVHFTILGRKYFGSFINYIQSNPGALYSMIGINPESMSWNDLYYRLSSMSSTGFAWDWDKYDSTIKSYLMEAFARIVNAWYNDEFSDIRTNICRALMVRPTAFGQFVFLIADGNPSGHFATSISNSIIQVLIVMSAFYDLAPTNVKSLFWFDQYIRIFVYGDDSLVAVNKNVSWFNFDAIAAYVADIGMGLQLDTKEEGDTGARPILNLTFLKRSFARDAHSTIVPLLNWDSMVSMLQWNRSSKFASRADTFAINSRVFSQFLYFYGEEKYNQTVREFDLVVPEWSYYDRLFYGGQPFPITF